MDPREALRALLEPLDHAARVDLLRWAIDEIIGQSIITEARRQRIKEGVRRAQANGVAIGRPRTDIDLDAVDAALACGQSVRGTARERDVSPSTLRRALQCVRSEPPPPLPPPPSPKAKRVPAVAQRRKAAREARALDPKIERLRAALAAKVKVYSPEELRAFAESRGVEVTPGRGSIRHG